MRFPPRRELGRTGFVASLLGAGDLADRALGLDVCAATLRRALEAGINVVDTAPCYADGFSEEVVGHALELFGHRGRVFVIDKVDHLDQPVAPQIEASSECLRGAPDAFVFHNVSRLEAWEGLVTPGGGMDQLEHLIDRGMCRFRGVSSHHPDVVRAAILSGRCDVVMFAVGPLVDRRYTHELLPLARAHRVGTVCFKAFGAGKLVADTEGYGLPLAPDVAPHLLAPPLSIEECVHATLSFDPDVALLGLSSPEEQDAAFAAAESFAPLTPEELENLAHRAAAAARGKGALWWNLPS